MRRRLVCAAERSRLHGRRTLVILRHHRDAANYLQESRMKQKSKMPQQKPPQGPPPFLEDVKMHKQKAEAHEVDGMHKNVGQKGHKGAR